jgi:preprotein translocase SecE subunit
LAVGSLVGVVYVLVSIAIIFHGLSYLWWNVIGLDATSFPNWTALILIMLGVAAGLYRVGTRLVGANPPHGLRAGIFVGIVLVFVVGLFIQALGTTIYNMVGPDSTIGLGVFLVLAAVIVFWVVRAFFRPGFERWLGRIEDQGWFTTAPYKASQGLRVRRGTIVGLLALAGCGIYTLLNRNPLVGDWDIYIPFTNYELTILPYQRYTLAILLGVGAIWFSWRVANYPGFADFLIATEAEMNKVSWTTRKRLVQDSIVVLTTVLLLTLFLFLVDVLWFKVLSHPWVRVLRVDTTSQQDGSESKQTDY